MPDLRLNRPTGAQLYMSGGSYVRRARALRAVLDKPGCRVIDAVVEANKQGLAFDLRFTKTTRPRAAEGGCEQ